MRLIILGSGTITPDVNRNASGILLDSGNSLVLLDFGPGILRRLTEIGFDPRLLDCVLISHFHPDHVADLVPFLFACKYAYGDIRTKPIHLIGPQGMVDYHEKMKIIYGHWIQPDGDLLHISELNPKQRDALTLGNLTVLSTPSNHGDVGLSYRINVGEKSVTISGDTDYNDRLIDLAHNTDLFICECSFPNELKSSGHLTPKEAGAMAEQANAGKLVLTHFYPPCDQVDIISQARCVYNGTIVKAEDKMVLDV